MPPTFGKITILWAAISSHLNNIFEPESLHRKGSTWDRQYRHRTAEVADELCTLQRRTHQNYAQIALGQTNVTQKEQQQQVTVSSALMDFVDENMRHARQQPEPLL